MKFDIAVNGQRLANWGSCVVTLDSTYSANAQFLIHSPGASGWLTNLSKVLITGRAVTPETALFGFESATDIIPWRWSTGLKSNGIDYTRSAFGGGSWSLTWTDQKTVTIYQAPAAGNMYGLEFWGWFHIAYLQPTFVPQVAVEAFASDGVNEWASGKLILSGLASVAWQAQGLRLVPTSLVPEIPGNVKQWGFRLSFPDAVPAALAGKALFTLGVDSINICGRTYAAPFILPPFAPDAVPQGVLEPPTFGDCSKWNAFTWANELHLTTLDPAWCVQGITWDHFAWADAKHPQPNDAQWG